MDARASKRSERARRIVIAKLSSILNGHILKTKNDRKKNEKAFKKRRLRLSDVLRKTKLGIIEIFLFKKNYKHLKRDYNFINSIITMKIFSY